MKPIVTKIVRKNWRNAYAYLSDWSVYDVWYRCSDKKYVLNTFFKENEKCLDDVAETTPFTSIG